MPGTDRLVTVAGNQSGPFDPKVVDVGTGRVLATLAADTTSVLPIYASTAGTLLRLGVEGEVMELSRLGSFDLTDVRWTQKLRGTPYFGLAGFPERDGFLEVTPSASPRDVPWLTDLVDVNTGGRPQWLTDDVGQFQRLGDGALLRRGDRSYAVVDRQGRVLWEAVGREDELQVHGDRLYGVTSRSDGVLVRRLSPMDGTPMWSRPAVLAHDSTLIQRGPAAGVVGQSGADQEIDPATGAITSDHEFAMDGHDWQVFPGEGKVIVSGTELGRSRVAAIRPETTFHCGTGSTRDCSS